MLLLHLLSSTAGWRTTTPCTRIPAWATAHRGSTSFPNPLRVRFNGVNSSPPAAGGLPLRRMVYPHCDGVWVLKVQVPEEFMTEPVAGGGAIVGLVVTS